MFLRNTVDVQNISVSPLMSRNRFDKIMKNLHLADNSTLNSNGKFSKVRPLIKKLNKQCLMQYVPEKAASIDESMVPYFGRYVCKNIYDK